MQVRVAHLSAAALGAFIAGGLSGCGTPPPAPTSCTPAGVQPLVSRLFANLGADCDTYTSLYAASPTFYHQHEGHKAPRQACEGYGGFCFATDGTAKCKFLAQGPIMTAVVGEECRVLAPYIWAQLPAQASNVEPHDGWEYMELEFSPDAELKFRIKKFAEIETTYSVPLDWKDPSATPALFTKTVELLAATAAQQPDGQNADECNSSPAKFLTAFFTAKSTAGALYRQQGDAVALAAGGICHLTVPFAAEVNKELKSGYYVLVLTPKPDATTEEAKYELTQEQEFVREQFAAPSVNMMSALM